MVIREKPRGKRDLTYASHVATISAVPLAILGLCFAFKQIQQANPRPDNLLSSHSYYFAKRLYEKQNYKGCVQKLEEIGSAAVEEDQVLACKMKLLEIDARSNIFVEGITSKNPISLTEVGKLSGLIEGLILSPGQIPEVMGREKILSHYGETLKLLKLATSRKSEVDRA